MDFSKLFSGDIWTILALALTFIVTTLLQNKKIFSYVKIFATYWAKIGAILSQLDDIVEATQALHQASTDASADGKFDPEELKIIAAAAQKVRNEVAEFAEMVSPGKKV